MARARHREKSQRPCQQPRPDLFPRLVERIGEVDEPRQVDEAPARPCGRKHGRQPPEKTACAPARLSAQKPRADEPPSRQPPRAPFQREAQQRPPVCLRLQRQSDRLPVRLLPSKTEADSSARCKPGGMPPLFQKSGENQTDHRPGDHRPQRPAADEAPQPPAQGHGRCAQRHQQPAIPLVPHAPQFSLKRRREHNCPFLRDQDPLPLWLRAEAIMRQRPRRAGAVAAG